MTLNTRSRRRLARGHFLRHIPVILVMVQFGMIRIYGCRRLWAEGLFFGSDVHIQVGMR